MTVKIKGILKNTLNNDLAHAILKLCETSAKSIKILLGLFLIVSLSLSAYLTIESCVSYFNFEVITTTRTVFETPTLFPKITICNINIFTSEYSIEFLKKINQVEEPHVDVFDREQMKTLKYPEKFNLMTNIINLALAKINSKNFTDHQRKRLSHDFNDLLLKCSFNSMPCTAEDFVWTFDRRYGNCYVFNSGVDSRGQRVELKKIHVSDTAFSLDLEFYVNFRERLTPFARGLGAIIRVDNNSYLIDQNLHDISITPSLKSIITIDRTFKFMLPRPYSSCEIDNESPKDFDSHLYKTILHSPYQYSRTFCLQQCFQLHLYKQCQCVSGSLLSLFKYENCESGFQYECFDNFFSHKFIQSNFIQDFCTPLCPLECNHTEYKASISSVQLNGEYYLDLINENSNLTRDFVNRTLDSNSAKESVVRMTVYYDSLSYTLSTESPKMDIVSLLANIGGNLGLFMGVSLFSLCELFEVLIEICLFRNSKFI